MLLLEVEESLHDFQTDPVSPMWVGKVTRRIDEVRLDPTKQGQDNLVILLPWSSILGVIEWQVQVIDVIR